MTDTRIESRPNSAESRTGKVGPQSMASPKATAGAASEPGQDFSSLLAQLDSFANTGLAPVALTVDGAADEKLTPSVPSVQPLQTLQTLQATLVEQETLLAAAEQAPWMSLVGQTTRLDAQGDTDLRQGAATDFLSGRGSFTHLAHRQGVRTVGQDAHAAFMGADSTPHQTSVHAQQGLAAVTPEGLTPVLKSGGNPQIQNDASPSQSADNAQAGIEAKPEAAAHKLQASPPQGVSLQGMTAVQPQVMEGLKDWLRAARSPVQEEGATSARLSGVRSDTDLQAAAAAVGAAMGAASAGMQSSSQSGSDFGQNLTGQEAAPSEREQEVSEQVAFWVHQKTQNAALSIQHEGKPIQVQVQLHGQQAHVRFAADDEQARQLLAGGQEQLSELLQAQGLSLSGVSVDSGGGNAQAGAGNRGEETSRGSGSVRTARVSVGANELQADQTGGRGSAARISQSGVDLFV